MLVTKKYGGCLVSKYCIVHKTDTECPKNNARSRSRDRTIAGGEHIGDVGSVAELLAVSIGERVTNPLHDWHAEGSSDARARSSRSSECCGILPSHDTMRVGYAEQHDVGG